VDEHNIAFCAIKLSYTKLEKKMKYKLENKVHMS